MTNTIKFKKQKKFKKQDSGYDLNDLLCVVTEIACERSVYWNLCLDESKTEGQTLRNSIRMCLNEEIAALAECLKEKLNIKHNTNQL